MIAHESMIARGHDACEPARSRTRNATAHAGTIVSRAHCARRHRQSGWARELEGASLLLEAKQSFRPGGDDGKGPAKQAWAMRKTDTNSGPAVIVADELTKRCGRITAVDGRRPGSPDRRDRATLLFAACWPTW